MSSLPFVSPDTNVVALETKTTELPELSIAALKLRAKTCVPPDANEAREVSTSDSDVALNAAQERSSKNLVLIENPPRYSTYVSITGMAKTGSPKVAAGTA